MNTPAVHLLPPEDWCSVAHDAETHVWITKTSSRALRRLEPRVRLTSSSTPAAAVALLRRTDHAGFAIVSRCSSTVTVECRSRAFDRLHVHARPGAIRIVSGLRHAPAELRSEALSSRFLAVWLANAIRFGSFDHFLGCGPFHHTFLVTQGTKVEVNAVSGGGEAFCLSDEPQHPVTPLETFEEALDACRTALSDDIQRAADDSEVVAECSGGIDSGLTAVLGHRATGRRFRGGVFADYPYREFIKERQYAQEVADRERFPLRMANPGLCMRWGALDHSLMPLVLDEPSLMLPFWGQVLASYEFVMDHDRSCVLNGLGGDLLFQERDLPFTLGRRPDWMRASQWDEVCAAISRLSAWLEPSRMAPSGLAFVNPWMAAMLGRLNPGAAYYSPLGSRPVIESIWNLRSRLAEGRETLNAPEGIQKPIAHCAFADLLPPRLWCRRWKVNFVGHDYRCWFRLGHRFVQLARRWAPQLESVNVDSKAVLRSFRRMSEGVGSADRSLNAVATYLVWLDHWLTRE